MQERAPALLRTGLGEAPAALASPPERNPATANPPPKRRKSLRPIVPGAPPKGISTSTPPVLQQGNRLFGHRRRLIQPCQEPFGLGRFHGLPATFDHG